MDQGDLLRLLVGVLGELDLRYFVTGSWASIYYGEMRSTNDVDIVVDLPEEKVVQFCARFPFPEFYLSEEAVRWAIAQRSQFNIIHADSQFKIDVMIPKGNPLDESRFARARTILAKPDLPARFAAPEDVILKKMEFYKEGQSSKHLRDIASMLKISGKEIDRAYIERWARELDVLDVWKEIMQKLGETSQQS